MSIELCVLGSGSSGNSSLVRIGGRLLLIDAGFGPRAIARRLAGTGVGVADIDAVLLTHLDRDHFNPSWCATLLKLGIGVYLARRHLGRLHEITRLHATAPPARALGEAGLLHTFDGQPFAVAGPHRPATATVAPIHLSHDRAGTTGFVVRNGNARLGYATDLGNVPAMLIESFAGVDLLAIESNYDHAMQLGSDRPAMLKRRVISGHGHLSNDQALDAVRQIIARSPRPPAHIVLLHLSRQCNCPKLVRRLYADDATLGPRLRLTSQHTPTGWLRPVHVAVPAARPGEQLAMFE